MALAFNKFNAFVEAVALKKHNLGTDSLKVVFTSVAPLSTNSVLADLTQIAAGNGYSTGGSATTITSCVQTGGILKLIVTDVTFTCSGGDMAPFRYFALYNDTATNKELIGFWDYGSTLTLHSGDTFTVDFDGTNGVLTVT